MSLSYRVDSESGRKMACYDVDVDVDDPAKPHMTSFFQGVSQTKEIQDLDAKVRQSLSVISVIVIRVLVIFPSRFSTRWNRSTSSEQTASSS